MQSANSVSSDICVNLARRIPALMEKAVIPGLSIAVVQDAQVVWHREFGFKNAISKEPVTADTIFEAASLSKPVFAYAVLKLCEAGSLDLDTSLAVYLPEPYLPDEPRLERITARHVLSHTPGFPNWRPKDGPLEMLFTPGERFSYSGEGYVYLQRVVEHITGQPLAEYIRVNLLEPFGMVNSSYVWLDRYETQAAQGHDSNGEPVAHRRRSEANVAASLQTTSTEFAQFMAAMLRSIPANTLHLVRDSLTEMLTPQVRVDKGVSWGLGWGIQHNDGKDAFWHWGDNGVFKAFVMGFKEEKTGVVWMTNSQNGDRIWDDILCESFGSEHPAIEWLNRPQGGTRP